MDELLAVAKSYHPALRGDRAPPQAGAICIARDNLKTVTELYQHGQQQHPEAGRAYWAARCWTLLIWQPIYLTLAAVHGCRQLPDLQSMNQHTRNGIVAGFSLSKTRVQTKRDDKLIAAAAQDLKHLCEALQTECQNCFQLHSRLATRLAADTLLSGLIMLPTINPQLKNNDILRLTEAWLHSLQWHGQSELMTVSINSNQQKLALNRKTCCFNYCCADGALCATCPKQSLAERQQRIAQELLQDA